MNRLSINCIVSIVVLSIFNSIAISQDYKKPADVAILSETEIFDQFIGNTVFNEMYFEFFQSPNVGENYGLLKGKSEKYGLYEGSWQISDFRICLTYFMRIMSALGDCYTVALVGEETRMYRGDSYELYPDGGRLKVVNGNAENL